MIGSSLASKTNRKALVMVAAHERSPPRGFGNSKYETRNKYSKHKIQKREHSAIVLDIWI